MLERPAGDPLKSGRSCARGWGMWGCAGRRLLAALAVLHLVAAAVTAPAQAQDERIRFIRDSELENLLRDYARPIFKVAGLGSNNVAIRIVRHESFNAFVLDGRNVFINSGLIMQAGTPNEVIGVIAHETGHITGGHLADLRAKLAKYQTASLILKAIGIGALIAGGASGSRDTREALGGAGKGVLLGGDDVLMRSLLSYRQAQESAADQSGLQFLTATRQSGQGMITTFERFAQQEYISDIYKDPYVRSHPMASQRLAQLRTLAERSPYYHIKDDPQLQLRHDMVRAKISGFLERPQVVFRRYPATDTSLPARYARAIARFEGGGDSGGLQAALQEVDQLIKERPTNSYFWELKGEFLLKRGRSREAIEPTRQALKLAPNAPLVRIQLAQALLATVGDQATKPGDQQFLTEAIDNLRKAVVEEGDNPDVYNQLALAYYKKGMFPESDLARAQSLFHSLAFKEAAAIAKRAQAKFPPNSPSWVKAEDIVTFKPPTIN